MITGPDKTTRQKGVLAIEVAMGLLVFLMMIFYWLEVSYMGFVSATVDYAVAESSRAARSSPATDYKKIFSNILNDSHSLWANFLDASDFTIQTRYFKSTNALDGCGTDIESCLDGETASDTSSKDMPLAIYQVSYPYQPLILDLLFDDIGTMSISREVITVQEYERELFNEQ